MSTISLYWLFAAIMNNPYWLLAAVPAILAAMGWIVMNDSLSTMTLKYVAVSVIGFAVPAFGFLFAVAATGGDVGLALPKLPLILVLTGATYIGVAIAPWTVNIVVRVCVCIYERVQSMVSSRSYLPVVDDTADTTSVFGGLCR